MAEAKIDQSLRRARDHESNFNAWFEGGGLKRQIHDNRERYEMRLKDKDEREALGLSTIPPSKSTTAVDLAVDTALLEYHSDPAAISFTAKSPSASIEVEQLANWNTQLFHYRAENTFPFVTWHMKSLMNGFVDGLEAAMVFWRKESYTEKRKVTAVINPATGEPQPIKPEQAEQLALSGVDSDLIIEMDEEEEVVVRDTWWIDALKPGENILWDFKSPELDLEAGRIVIVKRRMGADDLAGYKKAGVMTKYMPEKCNKYFNPNDNKKDHSTISDPDSFNSENFELAEVWIVFERIHNRWMVHFSLEGEESLSKMMPVDDVFWNGRRTNRLPVVLGAHRIKLWRNVGRGEPEIIAPHEDEVTSHKNNINDAARISVQGRWLVEHENQFNAQDLLNGRVAKVESLDGLRQVDTNPNIIDSLRAIDGLNADMAGLVPVSSNDRNIVGRGNARTLGAMKLGISRQNDKHSVNMIIRNQTFLNPLLFRIVELQKAFETDDEVLRIAAARAGMKAPEAPDKNGRYLADFRQLDIPVKIAVAAGRGAMTREQKVENLMQIAQMREQLQVPTDKAEIARKIQILAGYDPDAFTPKQPPQPERPDINANVNVDLESLPPDVQMSLLKGAMTGKGKITMNAQSTPRQESDGSRDSDPIDHHDDQYSEGGGIEMGGQGGID